MPLYVAMTEEGCISSDTKAAVAEEITRIHTDVMKVPENFVRVIFLTYPKGNGFTGGREAPTAALNCILRSGHSLDEKAELLRRLWAVFESSTRVTTDQLAISLQEIPPANAMEFGKIMPTVGNE